MLDQLFAKVSGSVPRQFIGKISDSYDIHRTGYSGDSLLQGLAIHTIYRILDGLITQIDGDGAIGIVCDV